LHGVAIHHRHGLEFQQAATTRRNVACQDIHRSRLQEIGGRLRQSYGCDRVPPTVW
jgi:hypothetical protein